MQTFLMVTAFGVIGLIALVALVVSLYVIVQLFWMMLVTPRHREMFYR